MLIHSIARQKRKGKFLWTHYMLCHCNVNRIVLAKDEVTTARRRQRRSSRPDVRQTTTQPDRQFVHRFTITYTCRLSAVCYCHSQTQPLNTHPATPSLSAYSIDVTSRWWRQHLTVTWSIHSGARCSVWRPHTVTESARTVQMASASQRDWDIQTVSGPSVVTRHVRLTSRCCVPLGSWTQLVMTMSWTLNTSSRAAWSAARYHTVQPQTTKCITAHLLCTASRSENSLPAHIHIHNTAWRGVLFREYDTTATGHQYITIFNVCSKLTGSMPHRTKQKS